MLIDLSHTIRDGEVTYPGLPPAHVCDFLSREASRGKYAPGVEFHIAKIELVANTGTYLDAPFHRWAHGKDVSELPLEAVAELPGLVFSTPLTAVGAELFEPADVKGKAVLVHTGWSRHFGTPAYGEGSPYLTEAAALYLRDRGAALVGIDALNIDSIEDARRPVHSILLEAGIPICEHLTALERVPKGEFRFFAVPPKVAQMGTFPVRAFARCP